MKNLFKAAIAALVALAPISEAASTTIMFRGNSQQVLTDPSTLAQGAPTTPDIPDQHLSVGDTVNIPTPVYASATGALWVGKPSRTAVTSSKLPLGITWSLATGFTGTAKAAFSPGVYSVTLTYPTGYVFIKAQFDVAPTTGMSVSSTDPALTKTIKLPYTGIVSTVPKIAGAVGKVTYSKVSGPFYVDPAVGTLYPMQIWSPGAGKFLFMTTWSAVQSGQYTTTIRATDSLGRTVDYDYNVTVNTLTATHPDATVNAAVPINIAGPTVSGATGRTISYYGLPPGLTYVDSTGVITGTVPVKSSGQVYPVTMVVTNSASGESLTGSFKVTVNSSYHRYWKWVPTTWTKTGTVAGLQFSEFSFYNEDGAKVSPTAFSTATAAASGPVAALFDGNGSTYWEAGRVNIPLTGATYSTAFTLNLDFGVPKYVGSIMMQSRGGTLPQVATAWTVYYSDKGFSGPWTIAWSDAYSQAQWASTVSYSSFKH